MARFRRLTQGDLTTLTREQLLPRLEAEQEYWARKERCGLSAADQQARAEFSDLVFAVLNPAELADCMAETSAWLAGTRPTDSTYWDEKPGVGGEQ